MPDDPDNLKEVELSQPDLEGGMIRFPGRGALFWDSDPFHAADARRFGDCSGSTVCSSALLDSGDRLFSE